MDTQLLGFYWLLFHRRLLWPFNFSYFCLLGGAAKKRNIINNGTSSSTTHTAHTATVLGGGYARPSTDIAGTVEIGPRRALNSAAGHS